jgi:hypothetical protein
MPEEHYQQGETVFYYDDGGTLHVEVLENKSDELTVSYELKILRVLDAKETASGSFREPGKEFHCEKPRSPGRSGLWKLADD